MLTMDTGKSQKGHGGRQENIQLPETEGNLRLGFPAKHPTHKEKKVFRRVRPQLLSHSLVKRCVGEGWGEVLAVVGKIL
jgi:hypothetical protein